MFKTDVVKAFSNALEVVMISQFNEHIATGFDKTLNQEKLSVERKIFFDSLKDEQKDSYIRLETLEDSVEAESLERFYRHGITDGLAIGRSI
jgi:hypothetical protein